MPTAVEHNLTILSSLEPVFRYKVEQILRQLELQGWQPTLVDLAGQGGAGPKSMPSPSPAASDISGTVSLARASGLLIEVLGTDGVYTKAAIFQSVGTGKAVNIVDGRWGYGGPAADRGFVFWRALHEAAAVAGVSFGGDTVSRVGMSCAGGVGINDVASAPRPSASSTKE